MEMEADQDEVIATDDSLSSDSTSEDDNEDKYVVPNAIAAIEDYLTYNSPVFRRLQYLRAKVSGIDTRLTLILTVNNRSAILTVADSRDGKALEAISSSQGSDRWPQTKRQK